MTEHPEDETLAWAREMVADLGNRGKKHDEVIRALGSTDPEADVLAAMAQLPENWQRCVADIAQRIAEELTVQPGPLPRAGRHRPPGARSSS